jgi:Fe-S cluster biogenesis protein NfuA
MSEIEDCTNLKRRIQHVISAEIAPVLQMDGGNIEVVGVQDGIVQVRLLGTCAGCPTSIHAIIMGIEEELRQRVPEVDYLEIVL